MPPHYACMSTLVNLCYLFLQQSVLSRVSMEASAQGLTGVPAHMDTRGEAVKQVS